MKKLFLSLVAVMVATMSYAQSSTLATLSHDGNISTFYGTTALREAYNEAQNGDVITLSGGSFISTDIKKALTIRGAGMDINNLSQSEPTILTGNFTINIADSLSSRLTLEGLLHNHTLYVEGTFKNGTFIKSRFATITYRNNSSIKNLTMIHCKVATKLDCPSASNISCINCIIMNPYYKSPTNSNIEYINCIVYHSYLAYGNNNTDDSYTATFLNCILCSYLSSGSYQIIPSSCTLYNNVIIANSTGQPLKNVANTTNTHRGGSYQEVFKTYNETYNDNETFELVDAIKSFKGTDGTEVGIHGGNMPFDVTPTNPQITKCNVAAKSTADGKLSVDITVNGAE